jgi:SHS2 domain-containing protein
MTRVTERWEHFPHGADIGIRGFGHTPEAAFANAALAMTAVVTEPANVEPRDHVRIECDGDGLEDLFYAWIDALVFETSTRGMLFGRFDVAIEGPHLTGHAWGEPVDRARHEPAVEVKGPTYTELRVAKDAATGTWVAQCVVDV